MTELVRNCMHRNLTPPRSPRARDALLRAGDMRGTLRGALFALELATCGTGVALERLREAMK